MSSISLVYTDVDCYDIKKEALFEDKLQFPAEKNTKLYSFQKDVCNTCKEKITDISRVLIMHDKDGGPRLLCFHFFFPCWDPELLSQQHPNLTIDKMGLGIPENISMKQSSIEDMQKNPELWI